MENNKTYVNLFCSIILFATNLLINFFLSPYIVKNLGVEANGFITLASNFITYTMLVVSALNSMASRYISISYTKKDYRTANVYYNSVFWGNLVIVAVLLIPVFVFIFSLERFINIPNNLVSDVKILFLILFGSFFLTTGLPNWDCGTFVANRLDKTYIPNAVLAIIKCIMLFALFSMFTPHIWYIGVVTFGVNILLLAVQYRNTKQLTPELKISFKERNYSLAAIKELVGSGIWNSISDIGNILIDGLDLLVCNIYLGPTAMGMISLSKILPNMIMQLSVSVRSAIAPELTINYAKGNMDALLKDLNQAMKITAFLMTIPVGCVIALSNRFFALWMPGYDSRLLQILSIIAIFGYVFTSGIQILFNVFAVVNKVKENSIAMLICSIISITITVLLLNFTNLGMFAVVAVSSICCLIRNLTFTLPMTAKYLNFKWQQFFPQIALSAGASAIIVVIGILVDSVLPKGGWVMFFASVFIVVVLSIVTNFYVILNKDDRLMFKKLFTRKFTNETSN